MHQENCQLKSTFLDYSTDRFVLVGCVFKIFATPKKSHLKWALPSCDDTCTGWMG